MRGEWRSRGRGIEQPSGRNRQWGLHHHLQWVEIRWMLSHCVGRDACGVRVREGERRGAEGGGTASSRGTQAHMTGGRTGEDDEGQRWMSHTLRHACRKAQAPAMRHARMINGRHAAFMPTVLHSCMRGHAACDADCRSLMPCPHACHAERPLTLGHAVSDDVLEQGRRGGRQW